MTVENLIAILKNKPQNALVVLEAPDHEYEVISRADLVKAEKSSKTLMEYYAWQGLYTEDGKLLEVVVLT